VLNKYDFAIMTFLHSIFLKDM